MVIETRKSFEKMFLKLWKIDQNRVMIALWIFSENPFDKKLRNHKLKGQYEGLYSIDAGFDLRIIYQESSHGRHELVTLIQVGSHAEIYG